MITKDKYGALSQIQPDGTLEGGDSAVWTGHYLYLTGEKYPFVETFEVKPGAYVRHPDPKMTNNGFGAYYKHPWAGCISRDQLTGIIAGLISQKKRLSLLRLIIHHGFRLFLFSYNTIDNGKDPDTAAWKFPDLTLFDIWSMYLRGFGILSFLFWPILCVLDLHLLLNTIHVNRDGDDDQINYAIKLFIAVEHVPTPTSKLSFSLLNKSSLLKKIHNYWCGWRNNCDMYYLYFNKFKELRNVSK